MALAIPFCPLFFGKLRCLLPFCLTAVPQNATIPTVNGPLLLAVACGSRQTARRAARLRRARRGFAPSVPASPERPAGRLTAHTFPLILPQIRPLCNDRLLRWSGSHDKIGNKNSVLDRTALPNAENMAFLALCRVNLTHPALYSGRKEAPAWIKSGSERFSKRSVRKRD